MATAAEKQAEKEAEARAKVGLADHRALTTADLPALAEYIKEANKPKRTSASGKASADKTGADK